MGKMLSIKASRRLLGFCLVTRFFRWVAFAISFIAVLFALFFMVLDRLTGYHDKGLSAILEYGGIEAACGLILWGCEKSLFRKYRM